MSDAEFGKVQTDYMESQKKALRDGWRVPEDDVAEGELRLFSERRDVPKWGIDRKYRAQDVRSYMRIPSAGSDESGPVFDFAELDHIGETDRRWSWVEINLSAIQNNIMAIKGTLRPETMFMAVVKADGYGHGAVACAKTALNSGADYIGVATIDEAMELRQAGIDAPMLNPVRTPADVHPVASWVQRDAVGGHGGVRREVRGSRRAPSDSKAPYHLKINTGMNRVGVRYDSVVDFLETISFHRALDRVGTFTHFATADAQDTMDFNLQKSRFEDALAAMRASGFDPGIVHAANSAATIRYKDVQYDMVRPGLAMYGYFPCPETYGAVNLLPAMSVKARITQINQVPVGEGVSYGLLHRCNGFAKICTVPIGYADGLNRALSGRIDFIMGGRTYPQVGNICMDQCMFEVDIRTRSGIGRIEPPDRRRGDNPRRGRRRLHHHRPDGRHVGNHPLRGRRSSVREQQDAEALCLRPRWKKGGRRCRRSPKRSRIAGSASFAAAAPTPCSATGRPTPAC